MIKRVWFVICALLLGLGMLEIPWQQTAKAG